MTIIEPLAPQRHLFDLPDDVAYLNCAYISPNLRSVVQAGDRGVRRKSRPWEIELSDFFTGAERVRELFGRIIGSPADDIALVPATSYGLAVAARNLPIAPGRQIVLLENQYPNNFFPWFERAQKERLDIVTVRRSSGTTWTDAVMDAVTDRTALAALPHAHWIDGTVLDLARIGAKLREVGAALVVDGTQSIGAMPFDLGAIRPDFLVAAGYKWLLCPYSVSFLYVAPHRQDGEPLEIDWSDRAGSENGHIWHDGVMQYRTGFRPGARKFDVGERANFALLPMAEAALTQLDAWGTAAIYDYIGRLTAEIAASLDPALWRAPPPAERAGHLVGFTASRPLRADLPHRLLGEDIHVSFRGAAIRVSPHVWAEPAEISRLVQVLNREAVGQN